jgi:hypothetical protein
MNHGYDDDGELAVPLRCAKANNQDDLDMDPPPPRRHQAGPSNIFNQIMGGMGGLGAAGGFGGFHRAAPPEYIVRTDRRNLADGIGLMMIISRHTRWRLWIEKIGLSCCMVARVSCIEDSRDAAIGFS